MINRKINDIGSNNTIADSNIHQQTAETINNDNRTIFEVNQMPVSKKVSILQEVLEGIVELDIELNPIEIDTKDYTIGDKIDHNKIRCYKVALDQYMQESYLIEQRLNFLNNNKSAMCSKRLYSFVKRVYMKHCGQADPDLRIFCVCDEIKSDLIKYPDISDEDKSLVPIIVFYVFSKCHIFEKPPIPS